MLANEIRPRKLQDVIGQDNVVKAVNKYLIDKNYPNVSCFCGASGCGKNTIANIVASILQSNEPIINGSWIEPNFDENSVQDIINERFTRDVHVYSGQNVTADVLRDDIEKIIQLVPEYDNNTIIIINEAQLCSCLKRLLETVETPRKNIYWIFTSTDEKKFTSIDSKDNKQRESNAFRSRMALFTIKPICERDLIERVGYPIVERFEKENSTNIDDSFADILFFIAKNCAHNVRQMINDTSTALNSGIKTIEEACELLGYHDEVKEYDSILGLCSKSKKTLNYIKNCDDLEGMWIYMRKILGDLYLRMASDIPFESEWKEKTYLAIEKTSNLLTLGDCLNEINKYPYFNDSVFLLNIAKYYTTNNCTASNNTNIVDNTSCINNNVTKRVRRTPLHD